MDPNSSLITCSNIYKDISKITLISFTYPLKIIAPNLNENTAVCYLISYGGGLVDGDTINLKVTVETGAQLFILTQASTKIFKRKIGGGINGKGPKLISDELFGTCQNMKCDIGHRSLLLYLPEYTTPFKNSSYLQKQTFKLEMVEKWNEMGSIVVLDWISSGRISRGESWAFERLSSTNEVYLGEKLVLCDAIYLEQPLENKFFNFHVFASILIIGPSVEHVCAAILEKQNEVKSKMKREEKDEQLIWSVSLIELNTHDFKWENDNVPSLPIFSPRHMSIGVMIRLAALETRLIRAFISTEILCRLKDQVQNNFFDRQL